MALQRGVYFSNFIKEDTGMVFNFFLSDSELRAHCIVNTQIQHLEVSEGKVKQER